MPPDWEERCGLNSLLFSFLFFFLLLYISIPFHFSFFSNLLSFFISFQWAAVKQTLNLKKGKWLKGENRKRFFLFWLNTEYICRFCLAKSKLGVCFSICSRFLGLGHDMWRVLLFWMKKNLRKREKKRWDSRFSGVS